MKRGAVLVLVLFGVECTPNQPGMTGSRGKVVFDWPGAPMSALASNGRDVNVSVDWKDTDRSGCQSSDPAPLDVFTRVESSKPEVAAVDSPQRNVVHVRTGMAGTAELRLLDATGNLVDSVVLRVSDFTKVTFKQGWGGATPAVLANVVVKLAVNAADGAGTPLAGAGEIGIELTGGVTRDGGAATATGLDVIFHGTGPGKATLAFTSGTLRQALDVNFVQLADITSVQLKRTYNNSTFESIGFAGVDGVYGTKCDWTVPNEVTVNASAPNGDLSNPPVALSTFAAARAASYPVACTIGAARADAVIMP
jgi:hypothetical protein